MSATSLFIQPIDHHKWFEKTASIARMPEDEKKWPAHVLSEMHKQLPFLSDLDVDIVIDSQDPEAGFALGYGMIHNRTMRQPQDALGKEANAMKIPVIIADRMLKPFHTFELGGDIYPLTPDRVKQAMVQPAIFDGPVRKTPGSQSLVDQLYPPYQQRQGFGRTQDASNATGIGKIGSSPLRTKADKLMGKKATAMLSFNPGDMLPSMMVVQKTRGLKLMPGVMPQTLTFLRVKGTNFVMGIPKAVAKKLYSSNSPQASAQIIRDGMYEEMMNARSGRPAMGKFLLLQEGKDGYTYVKPEYTPMLAMGKSEGAARAGVEQAMGKKAGFMAYSPGAFMGILAARGVAGKVAKMLSPKERKERAEATAQKLAVPGVAIPVIVAVLLGTRKSNMVAKLIAQKFNAMPQPEQNEIIQLLVPAIAGIGTGVASGALAGALVGMSRKKEKED